MKTIPKTKTASPKHVAVARPVKKGKVAKPTGSKQVKRKPHGPMHGGMQWKPFGC